MSLRVSFTILQLSPCPRYRQHIHSDHLHHTDIKYQKYLDRVVEFVSEDYGEIAEILNRHKTLKSANEDLKTRQKDTSTENEEERAEFTSNVKVCLARGSLPTMSMFQSSWGTSAANVCVPWPGDIARMPDSQAWRTERCNSRVQARQDIL